MQTYVRAVMYTIYNKLKDIAGKEFEDIVKATIFIGGKKRKRLEMFLDRTKSNQDYKVPRFRASGGSIYDKNQ